MNYRRRTQSRLRFTGELMTCCMCAKQQQSDPLVESGWRCIEVDGEGYYVCPDHLPADGSSSAAFRDAYTKILARIVVLRRDRFA